MADLFKQAGEILSNVSNTVSKTGLGILGGVSQVAKSVFGEDLSQQLFDNYVPLERYTEYQRTYNWEVVFPFIMGNIPGMVVSKYCKAIAFGDYHLKDIVDLERGPKNIFSAGTLVIEKVTAVFLVSTPNLVQGYFANWKEQIIDSNGFYSEQGKYKYPIYIRLYTTQGITAGTIKLIGAFPTTFFKYELSYETEAVVKYTVTFSIDDIEFKGIDIGTSIPRVLKVFL